ncbi:MAG: hypothetical protein O7F08_10410 [Deltaproteobacteria bacterium]|nr:hypothetical protein [Deltaproteobacteria bacterium]
MLSPKRVIPSLAVAMLPLTGTGCSSDDGGGTNGSDDLTNSIRAFCMTLIACYPDYYDSVDDCGAYFDDILQNYIGTVPEGCVNVLASYFYCLSGLTCDELAIEDYYQCYDDLEDDFLRECDRPIQ